MLRRIRDSRFTAHLLAQTNGIFEFQIKNATGSEECWTIDLKKDANVYKGKAQPKSDVIIIVSGVPPALCRILSVVLTPRFPLSDDTFADLADGKLDGQKAFMTGKLKTKGNMMLATKLGPVLTIAKPKAKL